MTDTNEAAAAAAAENAAKEVAVKEAADKVVADKAAAEEADKNQSPEQKQAAYLKRKASEAEKFKQKAKELEEELAMFKPANQDDDLGGMVAKEVSRRLDIDKTISEYIVKYPSLEEHREKIIKYAHDPSRSGIPITEIIPGAIGFEASLRLGASMKAEIEKEIEVDDAIELHQMSPKVSALGDQENGNGND